MCHKFHTLVNCSDFQGGAWRNSAEAEHRRGLRKYLYEKVGRRNEKVCGVGKKVVWRREKSWDKNGLLDACASTRRYFCRVNRVSKHKSLFTSYNSVSH